MVTGGGVEGEEGAVDGGVAKDEVGPGGQVGGGGGRLGGGWGVVWGWLGKGGWGRAGGGCEREHGLREEDATAGRA